MHSLSPTSAERDADASLQRAVRQSLLEASASDIAPARTDPRLLRLARLAVASSSLFCMTLGAAALVAAASDLHHGRGASHLPGAALGTGFMLAGAACWVLGALRPKQRPSMTARAGPLLAAGVIGSASVELAGTLGAAHPRDAWSAVALIALGLALLGIDRTVTWRSRHYWPAHVLVFAGGMLGIAGLLDAVLVSRSPLTSMPLSSALGASVLALGVVCARVEYSLGALLTSASLGGVMTRWLWPAAVVVPVLLGIAARHTAAAGIAPSEQEPTILILSMIALLGALVLWNGVRIDQNDRNRQRIQDTLYRREAELREAHRLARVGSWRWDIAEGRVTWTPELYRITGRDSTLATPTPEDLLGDQTPESAARFADALSGARSSGAPFELEVTLVRPDGSQRIATARGEADRDSAGDVALLRGTVEDITERRLTEQELARVHRAQRATSRSNQVLVRATDEATLLRQVCDIIIENTDYRACWVARAEGHGSIRVAARAGADARHLGAAPFSWSDESATDAVATCIRTGETVVVADVRTDARASAWRERALRDGLASMLAIPLTVDAEIYGALVIFAASSGAFGPPELALLGELAEDLAFGVTTLHTRAAHDRAEAQIRQLNADLEQRVENRTAELRAANELKDLLLLRQQATSTELARAREREADVGFRIQQTLLLDAPPADMPGLGVAASTVPSQRVDGDFYAFVNHHDQVLDIIVGDVMGKGILAALLGAATKAHFLKAMSDLAGSRDARSLPRPKDIVMKAHAGVARHLIELESFVTLCYARLDLIQKRLDFVDCGHTGIIHQSASTGLTRLLQGTNLPLGVREGEIYGQISVPIAPGDTFLLFSDGITDARDDAGDAFGAGRLARLVADSATKDPGQLIADVGAAVRSFSRPSPPRDDQTCVAVHVEAARLPLSHAELEIKSGLEELGRARDFVRDFCRRAPAAPLDDDSIGELVLAANEAASNIMKHAYAGDADQLITIEADAYTDRVAVRLRHLGSPFSPDSAPAPQFDGSRESGFGAYIIASSVDEVKYYRDSDGRSCVALFKKPRLTPGRQEHPQCS